MKKRRLIILFILLVIFGVLFFVWFQKTKIIEPKPNSLINFSEDKIPPSTAVISPENNSWHNGDFKAVIFDSDLGSGLIDFVAGKQGCRYIIEDVETGQAIGDFRKCEETEVNVPVGPGKTCSSSFKKNDISSGKCRLSVKAFDRAENDSGWKSKIFNIDLVKPNVSEILPQSVSLNEKRTFSASVSDNSQIIGCWLYINGKNSAVPVKINPVPCENQEECHIEADFSFEKEKDYNVNFGCQDMARNLGFSEPTTVRVVTNHAPQITSCRVLSNQFFVEASDPDGDELKFFWNFGDGQSSMEKNPIHQYTKAGTFEPKVRVLDPGGLEENCATAWVVVK